MILAVLAMSLPARAATLTIVDLPATGTDAAIGISSSKAYTHTFDFGTNAPVTINGVVFEQGPTANMTATYNGTSKYGYGYILGDTRATVNLQVHAGNDPAGQVGWQLRGPAEGHDLPCRLDDARRRPEADAVEPHPGDRLFDPPVLSVLESRRIRTGRSPSRATASITACSRTRSTSNSTAAAPITSTTPSPPTTPTWRCDS